MLDLIQWGKGKVAPQLDNLLDTRGAEEVVCAGVADLVDDGTVSREHKMGEGLCSRVLGTHMTGLLFWNLPNIESEIIRTRDHILKDKKDIMLNQRTSNFCCQL